MCQSTKLDDFLFCLEVLAVLSQGLVLTSTPSYSFYRVPIIFYRLYQQPFITMKFSLVSSLSLGLSALQLASARYVMYVDQ